MKVNFPRAVLYVAIALVGSVAAEAEIYVVRGKGGSVTFTSRRPEEGTRFKVLAAQKASYSYFVRGARFTGRPINSPFDSLLKKSAEEKQLDYSLVKAVVHAESMFNSRAKSPKGAMGLMQLMPATAKRFGVVNAYSPGENVDGGTEYLRWLLDRYRGDERLAVAAYNAGEGAVDEIGTVPPFSETQRYVRRVLKLKELYRCAESGNKDCRTFLD